MYHNQAVEPCRVQLRRISHANVGKFGPQFFEVPTGGCVDDNGLVLPRTLDFPDAVAEASQPLSRLGSTQVHVQLVALWISHFEEDIRILSSSRMST